MGWTLSQWASLPDSEKDFWFAAEIYNRRQLTHWWDEFVNARDKNGKPRSYWSPEVVQILIELARMGV